MLPTNPLNLARSPPPASATPDYTSKPPKSPPLAFAHTPNDALAPLKSPGHIDQAAYGSPFAIGDESDILGLQTILDRQAATIQLLHDAFASEREVWALDRKRLQQRIANLEKLLRAAHGYSPAKSPLGSPTLSSLWSPSSQPLGAVGSTKLPSIAEDDGFKPMSLKRDGAPTHINLPTEEQEHDSKQAPRRGRRSSRSGSVSFTSPKQNSIIVEDIPHSSSSTTHRLSPPPPAYREHAGHTPLQAPRRPTPPPAKELLETMQVTEDTPTRNNTHLNNFLTMSTEEEEDVALTGPLNMPELPHMPDETNFTIEMLSKKLQMVEQNPERNKPLVFSTKSPGLASPERRLSNDDLQPTLGLVDGTVAPVPTARPTDSVSQLSSNALPSCNSPNGAPLSQQESQESQQIQEDFAHGGIRLKKKPSTNFGAPFGVLGGYGSVRRASDLENVNA